MSVKRYFFLIMLGSLITCVTTISNNNYNNSVNYNSIDPKTGWYPDITEPSKIQAIWIKTHEKLQAFLESGYFKRTAFISLISESEIENFFKKMPPHVFRYFTQQLTNKNGETIQALLERESDTYAKFANAYYKKKLEIEDYEKRQLTTLPNNNFAIIKSMQDPLICKKIVDFRIYATNLPEAPIIQEFWMFHRQVINNKNRAITQ